MSKDLNKFMAIGNLGRDPEMRYTASGDAVCNFSIAVGDQYKDKQGNKVESTEWVNIVAFRRLAEICGEYLAKGSKVYISGKFKTDKYKDKDTGKDLYSTKIYLEDLQMLGGNPQQQQQSAPQQNRYSGQQQRQQPTSGGSMAQGPNGMRQQDPSKGFDNSFDDDIPF